MAEHAAAAYGGIGNQWDEGGAQWRTEPERAGRLVGGGLIEGVTGWAIGDEGDAPETHGKALDISWRAPCCLCSIAIPPAGRA